MFSGSDSNETQNYTQWALNPSTYQNVSNDQVDWAALAQQWIIMKEAGPPIPEQIAPPPPMINKQKKEVVNEGGEAPMDVENEEECYNDWNEGSGDSVQWNPSNPQAPWNWNSSWSGSSAPANATNTLKPPLLHTPVFNTFNSSKEQSVDNPNYSFNASNPSYWPAASSSKVIKPHNKRYSKVNVPVPVKPASNAANTSVTIDAAKRKQLPAWIREGLEKMERDKLKQLEKNRDKGGDRSDDEEKVKIRETAIEILKSTVKETERTKLSTYDDDEESEEEGSTPPRKSPIPLTQEEQTLKVRRTMTEILLKVTNREIQNICREEIQRHVRKQKASDQRVSAPTGANLCAKLGLGVYEGSGDSTSESEDEMSQGYQDSDSELRDMIRKRKEEFSKTERDIENRCAENEERRTDKSEPNSPDSSETTKVSDGNSHTPPLKSYTTKQSRKRHSSESSDSNSDSDSKPRKRSRRDYHSRDSRRSSTSSERTKPRSKRSKTPSKRRTGKNESSSRSRRSRSDSRKRSSGNRKYSNSRSRSRSHRRRPHRSRSRRRSGSYSRRSRSRSSSHRRYRRRSRSYSNGRGKRSHRH